MDESEEYPKEHYDGQGVTSMSTTSVHVTALDGLINVNSLFTIAVFMGLSLTVPEQQSLENSSCVAGADVVKYLLEFEVVSFSFFLFSSLVAQGLKLTLNMHNCKVVNEATNAKINTTLLLYGISASAVGSVLGCFFLILSMVNVIRIRLGMWSCSTSTKCTVVTLCVFVPLALIFYIVTAVCAFCSDETEDAGYRPVETSTGWTLTIEHRPPGEEGDRPGGTAAIYAFRHLES